MVSVQGKMSICTHPTRVALVQVHALLTHVLCAELCVEAGIKNIRRSNKHTFYMLDSLSSTDIISTILHHVPMKDVYALLQSSRLTQNMVSNALLELTDHPTLSHGVSPKNMLLMMRDMPMVNNLQFNRRLSKHEALIYASCFRPRQLDLHDRFCTPAALSMILSLPLRCHRMCLYFSPSNIPALTALRTKTLRVHSLFISSSSSVPLNLAMELMDMPRHTIHTLSLYGPIQCMRHLITLLPIGLTVLHIHATCMNTHSPSAFQPLFELGLEELKLANCCICCASSSRSECTACRMIVAQMRMAKAMPTRLCLTPLPLHADVVAAERGTHVLVE